MDAISDGVAGLKTLPGCMTICDLKNDNYYKLIAAEIPYSIDMKPKLKVKLESIKCVYNLTKLNFRLFIIGL